MKAIRIMRDVMLAIVVLLAIIGSPVPSSAESSKEKAIENVFRETFPAEDFLAGCHKSRNGAKGMSVSVKSHGTNVYCMTKHQGANMCIDVTFGSYLKSRRPGFSSLNVGGRKIGYEVIQFMGHETALREYENGSYKTISVEFYGDVYRFEASTTGQQIMSRDDFFSVLQKIDIDTFTEKTKKLLGLD